MSTHHEPDGTDTLLAVRDLRVSFRGKGRRAP
ncbi:ABC transporter ATP-binding protein, partial [Streptomyces sp. SID8380]|nr:ABC transporter ATP-binding protein [Streptomyces sp. SID8380]